MKQNKTTAFDPLRELKPAAVDPQSFKRNEKLLFVCESYVWNPSTPVSSRSPQSTRGSWSLTAKRESLPSSLFFSGRDELLWPWLVLGLFCSFQIQAEALDSPSALSENTTEICNRRTFLKTVLVIKKETKNSRMRLKFQTKEEERTKKKNKNTPKQKAKRRVTFG